MNRLVVCDPVAQREQRLDMFVDHFAALRPHAWKRLPQMRSPESVLVALRQQEPPEPERQLGDDVSLGQWLAG